MKMTCSILAMRLAMSTSNENVRNVNYSTDFDSFIGTKISEDLNVELYNKKQFKEIFTLRMSDKEDML